MFAGLSEEQELLRETVEKLAGELGPETSAELPARGPGDDGWRQLAGTGLLAVRLPESAGGMGATGVEAALIAEQLGRFVVPLPFIGSAVWASDLLVRAGASSRLLESLGTGELRLAPVLDAGLSRLARLGEAGVAWEARGAAAGLLLDPATGGLATLRLDGARLEAVDLSRDLVAVPAGAARTDVGELGGPLSPEALDRVQALALAALSADLLGLMEAALGAAVEHVREREQFGVKVGSFQAVQHMGAEARVSLEAARSATWYGSWAVDELEASEALLAARTAKAFVSEEGRTVCETGIQMHGGIGMTWECMAHVYLRRALLDRLTLGDEHAQLDAIAGQRLGAGS